MKTAKLKTAKQMRADQARRKREERVRRRAKGYVSKTLWVHESDVKKFDSYCKKLK